MTTYRLAARRSRIKIVIHPLNSFCNGYPCIWQYVTKAPFTILPFQIVLQSPLPMMVSPIVMWCYLSTKQVLARCYDEIYPVTYPPLEHCRSLTFSIKSINRRHEHIVLWMARISTLAISSEVIIKLIGPKSDRVFPANCHLDPRTKYNTPGSYQRRSVRSSPYFLSSLTTCDSQGTGFSYGPSTRRSMDNILVVPLLVWNKYSGWCGSLW